MRGKRALTFALSGVVALGLVACSQATSGRSKIGGNQPAPTSISPAQEAQQRTKIIGFARWPVLQASSLGKFVAEHDTIVVGKVVDATDLTAPAADAPSQESVPLPSDHPKAGIEIRPYVPGQDPPTLTGYSVQVTKVVKGPGLSTEGNVNVHQAGGMLKGTAYQVEQDPVIEIGNTYLFFLKTMDGLVWSGPPYGRFLIGTDGRLISVDPSWGHLQAVKDLSGLTLDEAVSKLTKVDSKP